MTLKEFILLTLICLIVILLWCWLVYNVGFRSEEKQVYQVSDLFVKGSNNPRIMKFQVMAVITQYNPTEAQCDSTPEITASGKKVREGFIACPSKLDFGDIVEIDGKRYICEDRMNSRYQDEWRFDILNFSLEEAREFGVQRKKVKIY